MKFLTSLLISLFVMSGSRAWAGPGEIKIQGRTSVDFASTRGVVGSSFVAWGEGDSTVSSCAKILKGFVSVYVEPLESEGHFVDHMAVCLPQNGGIHLAYHLVTEPLAPEGVTRFKARMAEFNQRGFLHGVEIRFERIEVLLNHRSLVLDTELKREEPKSPVFVSEFEIQHDNLIDMYSLMEQENQIFTSPSFKRVDDYLEASLPAEAYQKLGSFPLPQLVITSWHRPFMKTAGQEPRESNVASGSFRDCRRSTTPCTF